MLAVGDNDSCKSGHDRILSSRRRLAKEINLYGVPRLWPLRLPMVSPDYLWYPQITRIPRLPRLPRLPTGKFLEVLQDKRLVQCGRGARDADSQHCKAEATSRPRQRRWSATWIAAACHESLPSPVAGRVWGFGFHHRLSRQNPCPRRT